MSLTRVFTQTHRHFVADLNFVTVEDARTYGYPLVAECGQVWIPGDEGEVAPLPICLRCEVRHGQSIGRWQAPRTTFVYRCYDVEGRLLYVGCTTDPKTRLEAHRKNAWWWFQMSRTRLLVFEDRAYALAKESDAIAGEKPLWNVRGQDYSAFSLGELRERAALAAAMNAPEKYVVRYRREALRYHGATLALEAVS